MSAEYCSSPLCPQHPLHLHGFSFYTLARGKPDSGPWDPDTMPLNFKNPNIRDTATVNGNSYIVILFEADRIGTFMFHCHM